MEDWNDLRLILAIARTNSLTGAASALRVNHSTAFRRLGALEDKLGVRLFERMPGGVYQPTPTGQRLAAGAERIESETDALDRDLAGADLSLTGSLRVTAPESLAFHLLPELIARFRKLHPGIRVELIVDNRVLNLSRREADVALRAAQPQDADLFGRKLGHIGWTIYGEHGRYVEMGQGEALRAFRRGPTIGWEGGVGTLGGAWIDQHTDEGAVVYRTTSLISQFAAAREGIGMALLPCPLADREPALVRLAPPMKALERELWIVTHVDLKRTGRVRAFLDVIGSGLVAQRRLLAGSAG
jgi:DNA-binding transcriptional LysR family regulator